MSRRKRRNADDHLRQLERKANQTQDPGDFIAYWSAALRAGEIPKPNYSSRGWSFYLWVPELQKYKRSVGSMPLRLVGYGDGLIQLRLADSNIASFYGTFDEEDKVIRLGLEKLIETWHG